MHADCIKQQQQQQQITVSMQGHGQRLGTQNSDTRRAVASTDAMPLSLDMRNK